MGSRTVAGFLIWEEQILGWAKIPFSITYEKLWKTFLGTTKFASAQKYGGHCPRIPTRGNGNDRVNL